MAEQIQNKIVNSWHIHQVESQQFNSNVLMLGFVTPVRLKHINCRALLSYLMAVHAKKYPNQQAVSRRLMALYGASYAVRVLTYGNLDVLLFRITFAKGSRLGKGALESEQMIEEIMTFMKEMIFGLDFDFLSINQQLIENEKKNLIQEILAREDDKVAQAIDRSREYLFLDEGQQASILGDPKQIERLTIPELSGSYQEMLEENQRFLFAHGEWPEGLIEKVVRAWPASNAPIPFRAAERPALQKPSNQVESSLSIEQAVVIVQYELPEDENGSFEVLGVLNALFGGGPASLLFTEIREKASLAYNISSRAQFSVGLLTVIAECEPKEAQELLKKIDDQLQRIIAGQFTDEQFSQARKTVLGERFRTADAVESLALEKFLQLLSREPVDDQLFEQKLPLVTRKEVMASAKQLKRQSTFILTKKEQPL